MNNITRSNSNNNLINNKSFEDLNYPEEGIWFDDVPPSIADSTLIVNSSSSSSSSCNCSSCPSQSKINDKINDKIINTNIYSLQIDIKEISDLKLELKKEIEEIKNLVQELNKQISSDSILVPNSLKKETSNSKSGENRAELGLGIRDARIINSILQEQRAQRGSIDKLTYEVMEMKSQINSLVEEMKTEEIISRNRCLRRNQPCEFRPEHSDSYVKPSSNSKNTNNVHVFLKSLYPLHRMFSPSISNSNINNNNIGNSTHSFNSLNEQYPKSSPNSSSSSSFFSSSFSNLKIDKQNTQSDSNNNNSNSNSLHQ